jgi:ATP adenylyltransferase
MTDCPFYVIDESRIIATSEFTSAIRDGFPVTEGHTLVIPKYHVEDYFGLSKQELLASLRKWSS